MEMEMEMEPRKRPRKEEAAMAAAEEKTETALERVKRVWAREKLPKASGRELFMKIQEWLADPQKRKEIEEDNAAWEIVRRDFSWERFRDNWSCSFASFEENTIIPCMRFTDAEVGSPGFYNVCAMDTMQIVSVQVAEITGGLQWPLDVYGFVAIRDMPERRRIMVFDRKRDDCQRMDEDSYLTLTGPTRGVIASTDASYLEVHLKVKGAIESEDKDLSKFAMSYRMGRSSPLEKTSKLSTLELQHYTVYRSVEATISARVVDGTWPFGFRGELTASTARQSGAQITLLDFNGVELPVGADGSIKLSRRVVCVEDRENLAVSVYEYGEEEEDTLRARASFIPGQAKRSINNMKMGSCWIEVCVAWSLFGYWWDAYYTCLLLWCVVLKW